MQRLRNLIFGSAILTTLVVIMAGLMLSASVISAYQLHTYTPELTTKIYDRHGTLLYQLYENENRTYVSLDQIPLHLQQATLAIEDHRFYQHPGVDAQGIARALKNNLTTDTTEGGSTITQQYIKNAFLTPEVSLTRKAKEAVLALVLERTTTKDKILEKYLNEISYGGVQYGVASAAQYYFTKPVSDLTLAESALLAALPKAPSQLSPQGNSDAILSRKDLVLEKMAEHGYITQAEKTEAQTEELAFVFRQPELRAPHVVMQVKEELISELGEERALTGGLEVYSSIDYTLQQEVQNIVSSNVEQLSRQNVSNGAALVADPQTGEILAMVGSQDYFNADIDGEVNLHYSYRQPGSTFKPFTYALALEDGYTPASILRDEKTTFETPVGEYQPVNYDGKFHGLVPIRQALANSYNIPATRLLSQLGVEELVEKSHQLGFKYIELPNTGLSLTLGGNEVRPIDLAEAYTSFANLGEKQDLTLIREVTNQQQEVVYQPQTDERQQIWSPAVAYLISDILTDNQARTQAFGPDSLLHIPDTKVAVKTGTSNDKRDNWAVGYTPDFVVLAWVGNNNNQPMYSIASGLTGATPIWRQITDLMLERAGRNWFSQPANLTQVAIAQDTDGRYCDQGTKTEELFIEGTQPTECGQKPKPHVPEGTPDFAGPNDHGARYALVEERNGQPYTVAMVGENDYRLFQKNPFALIQKYSGQLQADDTPTPIDVQPL